MNHACEHQELNVTTDPDPLGGHQTWEVVLIVLVTGPLSFITILGNLLVVISFRVNRQLRTISNYYLLSLAVADLILGAVSMNLYTTYIIMGRWMFGNLACDLWLALDYVASNASVMNLLVISFDRYFSVTRPLTYRAKRTPKKAAVLITLAWVVSFVLWAPAILFWPHAVSPPSRDACSIPFLAEASLTCGTAIAAFYLPVSIMVVLYWRIYWEIENRANGLSKFVGSTTSIEGNLAKANVWLNSAQSSLSSSTERGSRKGPRLDRKTSLGCFPSTQKQLPVAKGNTSMLPPDGELDYREAASSSTWHIADDDNDGMSSSTSEEQDHDKALASSALNPVVIKLEDLPVSSEDQQEVPALPAKAADPSSSKPLRNWDLNLCKQLRSKRWMNTIIREKKAARILSAILLAFILTWTPYNIMVLASISYHVPEKLWQLGYWLCYVNSTINPMCYALCNETFRATFRTLLMCRHGEAKNREPSVQSRQPSVRLNKTCSAV
ncbi:muscarinic acetylcholine receptor M1 [Trichomycterus rosablanca]|uniref:muscarinic acetylcholine receptor M1 n=1 Tax=Trichomycterus rosablanca TaxID=2290929 RepID=UPI002F35D88F